MKTHTLLACLAAILVALGLAPSAPARQQKAAPQEETLPPPKAEPQPRPADPAKNENRPLRRLLQARQLPPEARSAERQQRRERLLDFGGQLLDSLTGAPAAAGSASGGLDVGKVNGGLGALVKALVGGDARIESIDLQLDPCRNRLQQGHDQAQRQARAAAQRLVGPAQPRIARARRADRARRPRAGKSHAGKPVASQSCADAGFARWPCDRRDANARAGELRASAVQAKIGPRGESRGASGRLRQARSAGPRREDAAAAEREARADRPASLARRAGRPAGVHRRLAAYGRQRTDRPFAGGIGRRGTQSRGRRQDARRAGREAHSTLAASATACWA